MQEPVSIAPPTAAGRREYRRRFSLAEKASLAAEVVAMYVTARWWLARRGFEQSVARLSPETNPAPAGGDQLLVGLRLGRIVERTLGVLPADSRCLIRSLVLRGLLARRGIASKLVIGVRSEPDFEAHAWVECAGVPLLPAGDEDYGRLTEL